MKRHIALLVVGLCLVAGADFGCKKQQPSGEQDTVLPGRHMSEHQVADIASRELPQMAFSCEFKDGVWEILEPQKGVWGVASATTNADGHVFIHSTNAMRLLLRVQDVDGKVEQIKTP
jgi:hypothetical protein